MENWSVLLLSLRNKLLTFLCGCLLIVPSISLSATINFRNVEIGQFIESMSELTGRNFLIDSRVRGKTTIVANSEVPEDSLYDIMLSVLRMHGFRAVDGANGLTRIVPANLANRFSPLPVSDGLLTEIIAVRHLDAASIIPIVRPLMTGEAQIVAHKNTNVLIITEVKSNIERVKQIIKAVDKKTIEEYEIIPLKHMLAEDMARIIEKARNQNVKQLVTIVTDKENDRLILTGPPERRLPLRALIAELDTPSESSDRRGVVRVVALNYANAEEMKDILKGLLTKQFIEFASEGEITDGGATVAKTTTDKDKDDDEKDKDQDNDTKATKSGSTLSGKSFTVQSDPATNVLIISGASNIVQAIVAVVERLDVPRPQVLIEAIIAELTLNRSAQLKARLRGAKEGTAFSGNENDLPVTNIRGLFAAFNFTGDRSDAAYTVYGRSGDFNLGLLIQALNTDRNINILATPSVMTLNNQEATIKVGEERSIQGATVTGNVGGPVESIERLDTDTELTVTPQITKGDAVNLSIVQKVKRVSEGAGTLTPVTSDREIETTVVVDDRKIVVLGGMVEETRRDTKNRIPLLSKIPLVGNLFKGRDSSNIKTNLMVFIRPTIFRTTEKASQEAEKRYVQLRLEQLEHLEKTDTLLKDKDETMLLPELDSERQVEPRRTAN